MIGASYPSFAKFIKILKHEQKHMETIVAQALSGQKKTNVTKALKALRTLALDYENHDILVEEEEEGKD